MEKTESHLQVKKIIKSNLILLEELYALDFSTLHKDSKDLLLSQLKITTGRLGNLLLQHAQK